jgi:putative chitinase
MKIVVDPGHDCPPKDTGAEGYLIEEKIAREVAIELVAVLEANHHQTLLTHATDGSSVTASLSQRCEQANDFNPDLFVSIHCNANETTDRPMGTEVYAASTKGSEYADRVEKAIVGLGFKSRGVKNGANLFVIKYTDAPAILVELFFCDSKADCDLYARFGAPTLAEHIAYAIAGKNPAPASVTQPKGKAAIESTPKPFDPKNIDWSNPNCKISKYFTVMEATKGDPARIPHPGSIEAQNILKLAVELDKLREAFGAPIGVTSWNRPPAINRAVGGVANSQHITGGAADVYPLNGMDIFEFQDWCDERWYGALGWGAKKGFVHLDIRNGKGFMSGGEKGVRWDY